MTKQPISTEPTLMSEIELWGRFIDGDKAAFSQLYVKCYGNLFNYGMNLRIKDSSVEDAIQDLFLRLYSRPHLVKDVSTIRAFLFRSVKNYLINELKKDNHNVSLDRYEFSFIFNYTIDSLTDEEEKNEIKQKIDNLLNSLTPRQKEIIYFRFSYEMEYEEISRIMGITEQSARNLIHKAFKKIRKSTVGFFILLLEII